MKKISCVTKKTISIVLLLLFNTASNGQSWQWLTTGGSDESGSYEREGIEYMDSDPAGNLYIGTSQTSSPFFTNIAPRPYKIGNYVVPTYSTNDGVLASFSCDGTLRWAVALGGGYIPDQFGGYTTVHSCYIRGVKTDAQGNVYVTGTMGRRGDPSIPFHFDPNFTLPNSPLNYVHKQSFFIAKYNTNGVCQWVRLPQRADYDELQSQLGRVTPLLIDVDPDGTIHIDAYFRPGEYFNGDLIITGELIQDSRRIVKYDTNGNYLGYISQAYSVEEYASKSAFLHDPNLDRYYYFNSLFFPQFPSYIGGQLQTKSMFLAAFDNTGTLIWKKEDANPVTSTSISESPYPGLAIDNEGNLYLDTAMFYIWDSVAFNYTTIPNSWDGQAVIIPNILNPNSLLTFIKIDPNGNTVWMKHDYQTEFGGGFLNKCVITGNELNVTLAFRTFEMDGIPLVTTTGVNGVSPALLRINKDTGVGIGLHQLYVDSPVEMPSAIVAGPNGSVYMAGGFHSTISMNSSGTPSFTINGGYDDFFIAKFGNNNCTLATTLPKEEIDITTYPNPVVTILHIDNKDAVKYIIYDALGKMVQMDALEPMGNIDLHYLKNGVYLLKLEDTNGNVSTQKIVKK